MVCLFGIYLSAIPVKYLISANCMSLYLTLYSENITCRHLLLSAGPQFSEQLWHNVCKGIEQIFEATLSNLKELVICFQQGSTSVTGDNGVHVKIVARKDSNPQETARFLQIAEQVCIC